LLLDLHTVSNQHLASFAEHQITMDNISPSPSVHDFNFASTNDVSRIGTGSEESDERKTGNSTPVYDDSFRYQTVS